MLFSTALRFPAMRLITLLNHCERFPGFVYVKARLSEQSRTVEIDVRPRRGSKPVCSGCHQRAPTYYHLSVRRFDFVPVWGFIVLLVYRMRRVECRDCGVPVEEVAWAIGQQQMTQVFHAVFGLPGEEIVLDRDGAGLWQLLGQGLPGRRVCGGLGARTSQPRS